MHRIKNKIYALEQLEIFIDNLKDNYQELGISNFESVVNMERITNREIKRLEKQLRSNK